MAAASLSLPSLGVFCDSLKGVKSGTKKYEKGSNDPQTSPARPSPAELKTARQTRERFQGCIVMKSMLSSLKFQVAGRCAFSRSPRQIVSSPGLSRLLVTTGLYRFIEVAADGLIFTAETDVFEPDVVCGRCANGHHEEFQNRRRAERGKRGTEPAMRAN